MFASNSVFYLYLVFAFMTVSTTSNQDDSGIDPACIFDQNLSRKQCFGLKEKIKFKSANACEQSCCSERDCIIWQYHADYGCWIGYGLKTGYPCTERESDWMGGMGRSKHRKTSSLEKFVSFNFTSSDIVNYENTSRKTIAVTGECNNPTGGKRDPDSSTPLECRAACETNAC